MISQAFADPEQAAPPTQDPAATTTPSPATTQSNSTEQKSDASATSTASASSTQPTTSQSSGKVVLVDKTMTDAQVKDLLAQGFKPQKQGDDIVYCRREAPVGSRFEQKICRTAEQINLQRSDSKEITEQLQRTGATPAGK
jgi:hypothetical protein